MSMQLNIEPGAKEAPKTFYIKIVKDGPYLVYGHPPLDQEVIVPNESGDSWTYRKGATYSCDQEPCALCRCGGSKGKPFCDGSHVHTDWDSTETADRTPLLDGVEIVEGEDLVLTDNEAYCCYVRFCDAYGRIWNLVQSAQTDEEKELVKHEAACCASGRLMVWDRRTGQPCEPHFVPSISIIEDAPLRISGPIWVKGGIRIESADGSSYEIRNRVTLCRCGQSSNKPFCDGTHASMRFKDGLPIPKPDRD